MADAITGSAAGEIASQTESLSPYAAPYVTDMLAKGAALANTPYQAYTGPLSAGASDLQTTAFSGLASLGMPTASTTGSFTGAAVSDYMNPYIEAALKPQLQNIARDAQMARNTLAGDYGRAGAFGGSRQAVADAELTNRALDRMDAATGTAYATAFDKAADMFGKDRAYGLDALRAQQVGGQTQRAIDQQGIQADKAQFTEEQRYPYQQVQYMQSLLQGLPIEALSREYIEPDSLSQTLGILGALGGIGKDLFGEDGIFTNPFKDD